MRCYFYAEKPGPPEESGDGVVSFCIPELNITFRARYHGNTAACEYASLLALLEFIEINPQLFKERTVQIFGDSFTVVNQVNNRLYCRKELEPFCNMARIFKSKFPYALDWVAKAENPANSPASAEA